MLSLQRPGLTTKGGCAHHEKLVSASAGSLAHGSLHASSGCFHSNCSFPDVYGIWPENACQEPSSRGR